MEIPHSARNDSCQIAGIGGRSDDTVIPDLTNVLINHPNRRFFHPLKKIACHSERSEESPIIDIAFIFSIFRTADCMLYTPKISPKLFIFCSFGAILLKR